MERMDFIKKIKKQIEIYEVLEYKKNEIIRKIKNEIDIYEGEKPEKYTENEWFFQDIYEGEKPETKLQKLERLNEAVAMLKNDLRIENIGKIKNKNYTDIFKDE